MDTNIWQSEVVEWAGVPSLWGILAVVIVAILLFTNERASDGFFVLVGHSLIGSYFGFLAMVIGMAIKLDPSAIGTLALLTGAAGAIWSYRRSD